MSPKLDFWQNFMVWKWSHLKWFLDLFWIIFILILFNGYNWNKKREKIVLPPQIWSEMDSSSWICQRIFDMKNHRFSQNNWFSWDLNVYQYDLFVNRLTYNELLIIAGLLSIDVTSLGVKGVFQRVLSGFFLNNE